MGFWWTKMILGFDEYMNVVLDEAEEVNIKTKNRNKVGRILLKGDNITLIQSVWWHLPRYDRGVCFLVDFDIECYVIFAVYWCPSISILLFFSWLFFRFKEILVEIVIISKFSLNFEHQLRWIGEFLKKFFTPKRLFTDVCLGFYRLSKFYVFLYAQARFNVFFNHKTFLISQNVLFYSEINAFLNIFFVSFNWWLILFDHLIIITFLNWTEDWSKLHRTTVVWEVLFFQSRKRRYFVVFPLKPLMLIWRAAGHYTVEILWKLFFIYLSAMYLHLSFLRFQLSATVEGQKVEVFK